MIKFCIFVKVGWNDKMNIKMNKKQKAVSEWEKKCEGDVE